MQKFLAVVNHEYKKIVLKWTFLIGTLLFPILAGGFAIVPALIFSIEGDATRIAVYDQSGKIETRLRKNLSRDKTNENTGGNVGTQLSGQPADQAEIMRREMPSSEGSFSFVDYNGANKTIDQVRRELAGRIASDQLDAYLIIPEDFAAENAAFELYSRKAGDFVTITTLRNALNNAVRSQRLADAQISEETLKDFGRSVVWTVKKVDDTGNEKENDGGYWAGFVIAFMIYLTLAIYGQLIMSAIVEEKETRLSEILFSSARPFELMMGKLVGVGLAGLTQLGIWIISASVLLGIGMTQLSASGIDLPIPSISPLMIFLFFIFFLLGFFIYASIFALIGSTVTTVQEGGQFAFLPIMLMFSGLYFSFAVIRDPDSTLSFWSSVAPFTAPMTMPVLILTDMPPLWQIALALFLNGLTIAVLVWLASRVYRVGMLMYGKKATIPEIWKWIRQK